MGDRDPGPDRVPRKLRYLIITCHEKYNKIDKIYKIAEKRLFRHYVLVAIHFFRYMVPAIYPLSW